MKIVVADDEPLQRDTLAHLVQAWGHEVLTAVDGAEAWKLVTQHQISLVLSDWMMPQCDGLQFCQKVRASELEWYVYIILCTGKDTRSDLIRGLEHGADDFVTKPVEPAELRVRLRAGERIVRLERERAEKNASLSEINRRLREAYGKIEHDLQAAARMQQQLLPVAAAELNAIHFDWLFCPSSFLAGDMFNFFPLDEVTVGFYLLDVSGHGVPAAMLSCTLSNVLSPDPRLGSPLKRYQEAHPGYHILSPEMAAAELNRRFCNQDDVYFTMIYGTLDRHSRQLRLCQAGHPHPVLLGPRSRTERLGRGGPPVGLLPDMTYECVDRILDPGDRIFIYSDGITECRNRNGEQFSLERLEQMLVEHNQLGLDAIMRLLESQLQDWRGSTDFEDDISLLALEVP